MKKIIVFLGFCMALSASGQTAGQPEGKKSRHLKQNELPNEVSLGYGYGSLFMTNPYVSHSFEGYPTIDNQKDGYTIGALTIGYNRGLTRVLTFGFTGSYMNLYYDGNYTSSDGTYTIYRAYIYDNIFSGIAVITFNYVNRPVVRLYSAVGLGVAIAFSTVTGTGPESVKVTKRQLLPGWQLTLIGIRVGHSLGGFAEIGVGTNATLSAGISYKFGD
jgi:hypothetical protein